MFSFQKKMTLCVKLYIYKKKKVKSHKKKKATSQKIKKGLPEGDCGSQLYYCHFL